MHPSTLLSYFPVITLLSGVDAMTRAEADCVVCMSQHASAATSLGEHLSIEQKVTLGLEWCAGQGVCTMKTNWYYVKYGGHYAPPSALGQAQRIRSGEEQPGS
ncbi:hypothetical protein F5Y04DRAFT_290688 [Hypomontagnella monticulosa]|nr:hypothetical protein F5Y04DRAFT_290688 [Hypomontagnella monticulosa]